MPPPGRWPSWAGAFSAPPDRNRPPSPNTSSASSWMCATPHRSTPESGKCWNRRAGSTFWSTTPAAPCWTRTGLDGNGVTAARRVDDYGVARDRVRELVRASVNAGDDPSVIAAVVLEAATAKKPRLRYPAGKRASLLARLRRYMPAALFD